MIKINDKILTTPLARKIAKEKGIDISQVHGSGFNGRVLLKDIESFTSDNNQTIQTSQNANQNLQNILGSIEEVKPSNIRKAIAGAMKNSWANVAYTNLVLEVNMTKIWNSRKEIVEPKMIDYLGVKVTFLPFIIKATAIALHDFPMLNGRYNDKKNVIERYASKNIGIAVDTPHGLFVPVIKNAYQKNIVQISKELLTLAKKSRDRTIQPSEMKDASFTISNYGSVGALHGVPVINYPEIGILGVGSIVDRVMANKEGNFYNGKVMHITCAADHRWVDGADIGRFLTRIKNILESSLLMVF